MLLARSTHGESHLDPLPTAAAATALAAGLAQATAQLVDFWAFDLRYPELNGNDSANAFGWLSVAMMVVALAAFAAAGLAQRSRGLSWALVPIFAFLVVDNRADLHERVAHGKLLFLPLLIVLFLLVWHVSIRSSPRSRRLLRLGLASLVVSFTIHLTGPTILSAAGWYSDAAWQDQVKVAVKEATEVAGWILLAFGAVARLQPGEPRLADGQAA